jgi:hypothetical protein
MLRADVFLIVMFVIMWVKEEMVATEPKIWHLM